MDEVTEDNLTVSDLFDALALLKREKDEADRKYKELQDMLVAHLQKKQQKSATVHGRKFTLVAAERTVIDEDGLKKGLGAKAWNKFTIRKLDRSKLEAALHDGSVDPVLVARHSVVKKDTPHIRISTAEQE